MASGPFGAPVGAGMGQTCPMGPHRFVIVFLALALLLPVAARAAVQSEQPIIDEAAQGLRSDPVYVDPGATDALSASEAEELRDRIAASAAGPIFIAVLPGEAAEETQGSSDELLGVLGEAVGRTGTYAAVVGDQFVAGASPGAGFAPGTVPAIADETVQANQGQDSATLLVDFVSRLEEAAGGSGSEGSDGDSSGSGLFLPVLILGGLGLFFFSRRRQRRISEQRAAEQLEEVRQVAEGDLIALGEDLRSLDLDVAMPGANTKAKGDYEKALECYERASADLDRARRPEDIEPVSSALEEGRYSMACAKARLEGRPPPERRPPCFFDPRHGPSERDVQWSPPSGRERPVPACEADAQRVEAGEEPMSREISVGGQMTPYWNAPYYYGPWAGGYFGGGLLPGLLVGSMLGGGMGFGWGDEASADVGGEGDFGGGDFGGGGGDFGGGGGDFGGGDFGG